MQTCLFRCHGGMEEALVDEVAYRSSGIKTDIRELGFVQMVGDVATVPERLIFEQERLPFPKFLRIEQLKPPIGRHTIDQIFAPSEITRASFSINYKAFNGFPAKRARGIVKALLRVLRDVHPEVYSYYEPTKKTHKQMVFWFTPQGVWFSKDRPLMNCPRMKMDSRAPSRSYLKIEEVFALYGRYPQANETVVDLGAAPGGWSWAFLKRGCRVWGVDNGPLKLPYVDTTTGSFHHIKKNGLVYTPTTSVDWMVSDMLIPPGEAFGLIKRWQKKHDAKRMVVTIKIPQQHCFPPLIPLLEYQEKSNRKSHLIQLYHNRREVTWLTGLV